MCYYSFIIRLQYFQLLGAPHTFGHEVYLYLDMIGFFIPTKEIRFHVLTDESQSTDDFDLGT